VWLGLTIPLCVCLLGGGGILNIGLEWSTVLLRIREIPGPNLYTEIGYLEWRLPWFLSVPAGNFSYSSLKQSRTASFHVFSNSQLLSHSALWNLNSWTSVVSKTMSDLGMSVAGTTVFLSAQFTLAVPLLIWLQVGRPESDSM